jgi:hypothetical protein
MRSACWAIRPRLQCRDVTRQQQLASLAIAIQLHRQLDRSRGGAFTPLHDQVTREILGGEVGAEFGIAHQVAYALQQVALGVEAELARRNLVAPFDAPIGIQQDHAIGAGLQGRQDVIEPLVALLHLLHALAQPPAHAHAGLAPDAGKLRGFPQLRLAQPGQQAHGIPAVHQPPYPASDKGAHQRRHGLGRHAGAGGGHGIPQPPAQQRARDLGRQQAKTSPTHTCAFFALYSLPGAAAPWHGPRGPCVDSCGNDHLRPAPVR